MPREKTPEKLREEEDLLELKREIASQLVTELARREGITRARVTQIMALMRLAPEIQDLILSLPAMERGPVITERALRPIARVETSTAQELIFRQLLEERTAYRGGHLATNDDSAASLHSRQA